MVHNKHPLISHLDHSGCEAPKSICYAKLSPSTCIQQPIGGAPLSPSALLTKGRPQGTLSTMTEFVVLLILPHSSVLYMCQCDSSEFSLQCLSGSCCLILSWMLYLFESVYTGCTVISYNVIGQRQAVIIWAQVGHASDTETFVDPNLHIWIKFMSMIMNLEENIFHSHNRSHYSDNVRLWPIVYVDVLH